ncbi:hypothetical protein QOZ80_6BG0463440 [Eleusine coracana subsp. coracana]|nr:hypothetical protein QOZ80_6BG0463440 [Eleusine coracana subsp. coracana]
MGQATTSPARHQPHVAVDGGYMAALLSKADISETAKPEKGLVVAPIVGSISNGSRGPEGGSGNEIPTTRLNVEAELIDLGVPSELDPVTYSVFFSDNDVVGAKSWPAAEAIPSTLTNRNLLVNLCATYNVPNFYKPVLASDLGWVSASTTQAEVGTNVLCIYPAALEAGLRFPLHEWRPQFLEGSLYICILRFPQIPARPKFMELHGGVRAAVPGRQRRAAGVRFPLLLFDMCAKGQGRRAVGVAPLPAISRPSCRLFTGTLRNRDGWRSKYFLLESSTPWKCPVNWGKPRRADVHSQDATNATIDILSQKAGGNFSNFSLLPAQSPDWLSHRPGAAAGVRESGSPSRVVHRKAQARRRSLLWPFRRRSSRKEAASSRCQCRRGRASIGSRRPMPVGTSFHPIIPTAMPLGTSLFDPIHMTFGAQSGREGEGSLPPTTTMWANDSLLLLRKSEFEIKKLRGENDELKRKLRWENDFLYEARVEVAELKEHLSVYQTRVKELEEQVSGNEEEEHAADLGKLQEEHTACLAKLQERLVKQHAAEMGRVKRRRSEGGQAIGGAAFRQGEGARGRPREAAGGARGCNGPCERRRSEGGAVCRG